MPEKPSSYLAGVKAELAELVVAIGQDDDIDADGIINRLWKFMEAKIKESFMNGKKSAGNGSQPERKTNAFRRS